MKKIIFGSLITVVMLKASSIDAVTNNLRDCSINPLTGVSTCDESKPIDINEVNIIIPENSTTTTTTDGGQVIEVEKQTLTDGTTSKTKVEVKKDGKKASSITITNPKTGEVKETTVQSPTNTKVEIKKDGTVVQTFGTKNVSNEVTVANSGKTNAKVNITTGEKREFSVPVGAATTINDDGSTIALNQVQRDDGKSIQTQVETKPDGGLEAVALLDEGSTARITKLTSGQILARYSARREFSDIKVQVLFDDSNKRVTKISGGRFLVEFSARREFSYKYEISSTNRVIEVTGDNIIITPASEATIFEETQSFDGTRTLKILSGDATINVDGEVITMVVGEDYALPAIKAKTLNLVKGWNLISIPVDIVVDDFKILGDYQTLAKFSSGVWLMDSKITEIKKSEGFWIKMNSEKNVSFNGYEYTPNATHITSKWNLLGTGKELNVDEFKSKNAISNIYKFDAPNKKWLLTPSTISVGDGFWAKIDNESFFEDDTLLLLKGWNLISLPIDDTITNLTIFSSSELYKFKDGKWVMEPVSINRGEGFWIKMDYDKTVEFKGDGYSVNFKFLDDGWNLLGTGENIENTDEIVDIKKILVFSARHQIWLENPNKLYRGQGFWIKK